MTHYKLHRHSLFFYTTLYFYLSLFHPQNTIHIATALSSPNNKNNNSKPLPTLPQTPQDIIRQASTAISHAFSINKIHHQSIRLPLSESMYSNKEEGFVADRAIGWQGGPQETLRFLSPLTTSLLKEIKLGDGSEDGSTKAINDGGLPPRIKEQTLLDFDGSSLLTAESSRGPLYDIQALLQANTDSYYLDTISTIEQQFSNTPDKPKRLFILVNSAWRDDDTSSWGFFDGKRAQRDVLDRYETTYALDQFVMRGFKVSLLKCWPYDWCVYCGRISYGEEKEEVEKSVLLGSFRERPKYREMEELLLMMMMKKKNDAL